MGLKAELKNLVDELDHVHNGAEPWSEEVGIPEFVTADNGMQRYFTRRAREALRQFTNTLYQNRTENSPKIGLERYEKLVRQAVADMHAAGKFFSCDTNDNDDLVSNVKSLIEERLASVANEYTHYFPAWTLGMEIDSPFSLGPVTFMNRADWINSVDFPSRQRTT